MKKYPFYTAITQLSEIYGIDLDEDTFETYAYAAWKKIGNKDYKMYRLKARPEKDPEGGWFIERPCNMDAIEAITLNFEDAQETSSRSNYQALYNHDVEQWIEARKRHPSEFYISGKLIKYKELGDRIYFMDDYPEVNVLYKGLYVDKDGLPFINDKELEAIVAYCACTWDFKHARQTKDANLMQIALAEKQEWLRLCSEARTPIDLSENQMNEILDAMTSWNMHSHGVSSTKPIL